MLISLATYNELIFQQSNRVEKSTKKINFFSNFDLHYYLVKFAVNQVLNQKEDFFSRLYQIKGLYASISENKDALRGTDLSRAITSTNNIIEKISYLQSAIDSILKRGYEYRTDELELVKQISVDTSNILYDCARLLRRLTTKYGIDEQSPEATLAISISGDTYSRKYAH